MDASSGCNFIVGSDNHCLNNATACRKQVLFSAIQPNSKIIPCKDLKIKKKIQIPFIFSPFKSKCT